MADILIWIVVLALIVASVKGFRDSILRVKGKSNRMYECRCCSLGRRSLVDDKTIKQQHTAILQHQNPYNAAKAFAERIDTLESGHPVMNGFISPIEVIDVKTEVMTVYNMGVQRALTYTPHAINRVRAIVSIKDTLKPN